MNASALLQQQGWTPGTSLHPHKPSALSRPLLVSKKVDVLGLGTDRHAAVSDQWWLRAFDDSLKAIGTGRGGALAAVVRHGVGRGGLYARFVRGEVQGGTIGVEGSERTVRAEKKPRKDKARGGEGAAAPDEARRAKAERRAARRAGKETLEREASAAKAGQAEPRAGKAPNSRSGAADLVVAAPSLSRDELLDKIDPALWRGEGSLPVEVRALKRLYIRAKRERKTERAAANARALEALTPDMRRGDGGDEREESSGSEDGAGKAERARRLARKRLKAEKKARKEARAERRAKKAKKRSK